ncbi:MAG: phosphomannomutase/phosphoglucomutase [Cycloclasticus sp.]|nr:phosphomannomutase/phosphoglucomutase [Cycloclasticus sp.]MBQ0789290.1 phosphomannomutase/phosphoglucomutase [Cycloclasticus sp.]
MMKKVLPIVVLIIISAAVAGYVHIGQLEQQSLQQEEQLTARIKVASLVLSARVQSWSQELVSIASDEALISTLRSADQQPNNSIEQRTPSSSEMTSLRVVQASLLNVDMSLNPPLDYAGLDLIRRASESKKMQLPEAHLMAKDVRHIAMTAPVIADDVVIAVVMATFSAEAIQRGFKKSLAAEKDGWIRLKQDKLVLVSIGDSTHSPSKTLADVSVVGTRWSIASTRQMVALPITQQQVITYASLLIALIFFIAWSVDGLQDKDKRQRWRLAVKKLATTKRPKLKAMSKRASPLPGIIEGAENAPNSQAKVKTEADIPRMFMPKDSIEVADKHEVPKSIFRAYDIRGIVGETLTEEGVLIIGQAIATQALSVGQKSIVIARDGRLHSPSLSASLAKGIQSTGCDVVDIGMLPTPVLYFATHHLDTQSGVMITGSHNPANYNGLKIVIAGETLSGEAIQNLYQRIEKGDFVNGEGSYHEHMMLPDYIGTISRDIRLGRMIKVVVDCGNGVAGEAAPMLLSTLGCEVVPLYCDIDGHFPNHHPDPSKPENLQELINKVREENAELGLAFDGDGDRLGVVDSDGNIIWPDRQMMLYAIDVLSRQAGADIIYDVKCTRNLAKVIAKHGGKPVMSKTGHSLIKAKMKQIDAELAGEMSGHIFFKERWFGFDDALYTASRLLEIVTAEFRPTSEIFADLPDSVSTPELNITLQEGENVAFIEQLQSQSRFEDANIITIDGMRVEFQDGWGLVRASNTTPSLVLRFEADNEQSLERIKQVFREQMLIINAELNLPF